MTRQLICALVIALCVWTIQDWRYGAKEAENAQNQLLAQQQLAAAAIRRVDNVIEAQNAAAVRERGLRSDAAGARTALDGLRASTDAALRSAVASHEACLERAATLGELFGASTKEYSDLAEKAGRHASDVQKLSDAFPQ